jgi:hypothetical protein
MQEDYNSLGMDLQILLRQIDFGDFARGALALLLKLKL